MHDSSVSIAFVNAALHHLSSQPGLKAQVLRQNDLSPDLLSQPSARISRTCFANLTRDAMQAMNDEQLGHARQAQPLGTWATMAQLTINAENLEQALRRLARFYRLVPWGIKTYLREENDSVQLHMQTEEGFNPLPYLFESFLFYIYRYSNWLTDQRLALSQVNFSFSRPTYAEEYRKLFYCHSVSFSQPNTCLLFSKQVLQLPIQQNETSLKKFLLHTNHSMIVQTLTHNNWQSDVEKLLTSQLRNNPDIGRIAQLLQVHPHTLRTRLREEGTQFHQVREQLRRNLAIELLQQPQLSIEHISNELGYSETSAFSRAFKRWLGISPLHFRQQPPPLINDYNS